MRKGQAMSDLLFIFEGETLQAMLADAERIAVAQVNDAECRAIASQVASEIKAELEARTR